MCTFAIIGSSLKEDRRSYDTNLSVDSVEGFVDRIRGVIPILPDNTICFLQETVLSLLLPPVGQIS